MHPDKLSEIGADTHVTVLRHRLVERVPNKGKLEVALKAILANFRANLIGMEMLQATSLVFIVVTIDEAHPQIGCVPLAGPYDGLETCAATLRNVDKDAFVNMRYQRTPKPPTCEKATTVVIF